MKVLVNLFFICLIITKVHASPDSYIDAKRIARKIFNENPKTLYCGCKYDNFRNIDLKSCNLESIKQYRRARKIEWEHMMPAENFGRHFKCWFKKICEINGRKFKGRECCQITDPRYREIEAELFNLWPSVGLINKIRANYQFSPLDTEKKFGCNIKIDNDQKLVEPPDNAKGIVARANLFVADKYLIRLSSSQRKLFEAWNKQFPPTAWEKIWALKVAKIQGYANPYYSDY